MNWLIWKEYRVNRLIIFIGLGLLLVPHAIALIITLRHPDQMKECFGASMGSSFFVTQIVFALLGGNAIAGERSDRSVEFLACLPFSRWKNLLSKLVFAPLAVVAICGVNFIVLLHVSGERSNIEQFSMHDIITTFEMHPESLIDLAVFIVTPLTFFCVSWLFSSFMSSVVLSAATGLFTPVVVIWGVIGVGWWMNIDLDTNDANIYVASWYSGICAVLSLASFIAGTWYYLRRVEP